MKKNLPKIGAYCVVEEDVEIGDNCEIGNYVLIKSGTKIGDNVFIDSYVRFSGNCVIGDNVTLRYGCTIARGVHIKDGVFMSPNVMTIYSGPHNSDATKTILIEEDAYIGTAAVIGEGVKIGKGAIIGAMAYVTKDCEPGRTYIGVPARDIKK